MTESATSPVVSEEAVEAAAEALLRARKAAHRLEDAERFPWLCDLVLGRRVASRLEFLLERDGSRVAGAKLGADDASARRALGLSDPIVAPFFDKWTLSSGARLPLSRLVEPKIECEIGFRREHGRWQPFACLEVADSRLGWSDRGGQVIADFALNGTIVEGSPLTGSDDVSFELRHDGASVVAAVASMPVALERTERLARELNVGSVASGSLHPLVELAPGEWTLEFAGGGSVSVNVEPTSPDLRR